MLSSALTSASICLGKCSLNLGLQVCMLPSFTDKQRAALLACCTALLYTPVNEHFGIVPLEAMAAGRPVIACNSGGPKESILHLQTGYLCEPEAGSFAPAMRRLLVCICCFLLHCYDLHCLMPFLNSSALLIGKQGGVQADGTECTDACTAELLTTSIWSQAGAHS